MMKTLTDVVSNTHGDLFFQKKLPLTCLIKLAKYEPRFLRMQLVDVVSTVLDIVEVAECLEEKVRCEGVEFLLTLVEAKEKAPGMMRKLPLFVGRCFTMLLKLLVLDIKDDPAWQSAETLHDLSGTTGTFHVGSNGLTRFSRAFGHKFVAHEAKEQLSAYLAASEWETRHAALFALVCIGKGCSETHAALALSFICDSNKPEDLIALLDGIVYKLLVLLQSEKPIVLQQTLKSFTLIAQFVKENFQTYYDPVVPHLKGLLRNADLKSDISLREVQ